VGGDSCHPYIHLCNCCLILKCRKRSWNTEFLCSG
jgi:hypothetical protein